MSVLSSLKSKAFWQDVLHAWLVATTLSGIPSTFHAWVTGGDLFEATRAAGTMLLPVGSSDESLFWAAALAHCSISLFWAVVSVAILPKRRVIPYAVLLAVGIGILDLRVLGPLFPEVYRLPLWPQLADHVGWGLCVGVVLFFRNRHRGKLVSASPVGDDGPRRSGGHPRMTRPPLEPPPEAEWIRGSDGARLYTRTLLPRGGEPKGVVFFVLGPEVGAAPLYPTFVAALLDAGLAVFVLHPRGTGYSPGLRGDLADFRLFLADQQSGLEEGRRRFSSTPLFLLGHSVGAAFALELAATNPELAGLVAVNPAYKLLAGEGLLPSIGDYLTFAANLVFRPSALTVDMNSRPSAIAHAGDRAEAEAMQADPLVVRYFSMRFMRAQQAVMKRCAANAASMAAPLLLVQGGKDALCDPRGHDEILAAARSPEKTKLVAPDAGHGASAVETMVEPILAWLKARLPAASLAVRGPGGAEAWQTLEGRELR